MASVTTMVVPGATSMAAPGATTARPARFKTRNQPSRPARLPHRQRSRSDKVELQATHAAFLVAKRAAARRSTGPVLLGDVAVRGMHTHQSGVCHLLRGVRIGRADGARVRAGAAVLERKRGLGRRAAADAGLELHQLRNVHGEPVVDVQPLRDGEDPVLRLLWP